MVETVSNMLRSPANLIPCPYVSGIANEPSTWPITVHCGTSKTLNPSGNHLPRTTRRPVPLYHRSIPHYPHSSRNLQNNGIAGGRTNRHAERTTLHFYISMQSTEKSRRNALRAFSISLCTDENTAYSSFIEFFSFHMNIL